MSKPFKYSKKYVNSLTDYELRKLSDEHLYKLQKLYKIHQQPLAPLPYTPKEIASIINSQYKTGRHKRKKSKRKKSKSKRRTGRRRSMMRRRIRS